MRETISVDARLDEWLRERDPSEFPRAAEYAARFTTVSEHLRKNVHENVVLGNVLSQMAGDGRIQWDQAICLNNHGSGHVDVVMERASDILGDGKAKITALEGYLLLMAIQFHDIGNIFGRDAHEKEASRIMQSMGDLAGDDSTEKSMIVSIAAAHGGNTNGDKDTIGRLGEEDGCDDLWGDKVRTRFLAGVLRLADELADDHTRASRFLLQEGLLPPASRVHHAYSESLRSVAIREGAIRLKYEFSNDVARRRYVTPQGGRFLIDEILRRTLKTHYERAYCMRFLRPYVVLERIEVTARVCDRSNWKEVWSRKYRLEEKGYPDSPPGALIALCPAIADLTGQSLCDTIGEVPTDA